MRFSNYSINYSANYSTDYSIAREHSVIPVLNYYRSVDFAARLPRIDFAAPATNGFSIDSIVPYPWLPKIQCSPTEIF